MFAGIDFGTSNSSLALCEREGLRFFTLDPRNLNPRVLPSCTYITRSHGIKVGIEAIEAYLDEETGRKPVWEKRSLGIIEITVGGGGAPITYEEEVIAEVDVAANGRLLQSIKTALRDASYEGTLVFDRFYKVEDLIAILLGALRERAEAAAGHPIREAVIGRPVTYSHDPQVDRRAQAKMRDAALHAGFDDVVFELEPIGGAYLYHQTAPRRENILVFDFGGGTLDMTMIEVGGSAPPETIATHGVLLGGDDLTAALMRTLFKWFGEGSFLPDGMPFPLQIFHMLESWQTIVELSRPQYAAILERGKRGSDRQGIKRLEALAARQLGFDLFQTLERTKIALSSEDLVRLEFVRGDLRLAEWYSRAGFESLIADRLAQADEAIDELLRKSGMVAEDISAVLRTGGSAEIPAFVDLLARRFGRDRIREIDPFTTIVGGLALRGRQVTETGY